MYRIYYAHWPPFGRLSKHNITRRHMCVCLLEIIYNVNIDDDNDGYDDDDNDIWWYEHGIHLPLNVQRNDKKIIHALYSTY